MPRFYFDIDDGAMITPPVEGFDFADAEAARVGFFDALVQVAASQPADGNPKDFIGTLEDDTGAILLNIVMSVQSEWL